MDGVAVAERTGYTPVQVSRIRHRFAREPFVWTKDPSDIIKKAVRRSVKQDFAVGALAQ